MVTDLVRRIDAVGGGRRVSLALLGGGLVILILGVTHWVTQPEWILLTQAGDPGEVGRVAERLDEEGIPYRLEGRGTGLSVPASEMARARVAIARSGVPLSGRPGFELFDQPTWGMTDFTQRINYRRALEGELERTIGRMRGVESAQVHLGLQESAVLRRTGRAAEASVVVSLAGGRSPEPTLAAGIASLVAGSVDGLDARDVTILDDSGRLLSQSLDDGPDGNASDRNLRVRKEVETHLEEKVEELLRVVVGEGNMSVRVSAELDFDRVERTVRSVDPDRRVVLQEDRSQIIPGNEDQGAAQTITSTTYEPARSVESFNRSGARLDRLTVAVVVGHRSETGEGGQPVEVPRDPEELATIELLVSRALGLVPERGDAITVTNLPFVTPGPGTPLPSAPPPQPMGILDWIERLYRPLLGLTGLFMAFGMGLSMMRAWRRAGTAPALPGRSEPPALGRGSEGGKSGPEQVGAGAAPTSRHGPTGARGSRAAPERPSVEDPELTARVVRAWMKEA